MPVGLLLARRARHRIAADAAIIERQGIELGELVPAGAHARPRIALGLVSETELAPQLRPQVAVETGQRVDHLLGVLAADVLERAQPPGAAHQLLLDLLQRAPRRG